MANKQKWYGSKEILEKALKEKTVREIEKEFGVYFKTIYKTCKELGICTNSMQIEYDKVTNKLNKALQENPYAGIKELSELTGVSEATIATRAKRKEITILKKREIIELELSKIETMCKTMSISQISKALGVGHSRVSKFLRDNGLTANSSWYQDALTSGKAKHWTKLEKHKERLASAQPKEVKKKEPPKTISTAAQIIWPDDVKVTVYQRKSLDDPRNVMSKQIYNPSERGISWRY